MCHSCGSGQPPADPLSGTFRADDFVAAVENLCIVRAIVSRPMNTMTFVASATASSSRSDDDAMSVTSWRRSDKEIDAVPPPPFGLMGVAGDLCVARRRRCPCITSSSLLDLPSQAPSANVMVFMGRDTTLVSLCPAMV